MKHKLVAFGALLVVGGLATFGYAQAQEQRGLSVSPPILELAANPGDNITQNVRIDNLTPIPQDITVDIRNFRALGEEGQPELLGDDVPNSLANWIEVAPSDVTIPAEGSQVFAVTVNVPANAPPGGHYSATIFRTAATPLGDGSGVAVGQEIGSLVLLRVAGDIEERLSIESFATTRDFWQRGPVELEARLANHGNVHIRPGGNVTIRNIFGRTVAILPLEAKNVLPDSIRRFENSWEQRWLWGRYTATLSASYGSEGEVITATVPIYGFSVAVVGGSLAGLIVLSVLLYLGRQRLRRAFRIILGKE